jgi:hypothetical protein
MKEKVSHSSFSGVPFYCPPPTPQLAISTRPPPVTHRKRKTKREKSEAAIMAVLAEARVLGIGDEANFFNDSKNHFLHLIRIKELLMTKIFNAFTICT